MLAINFSLEDIQGMTNFEDERNKLGEGGFGIVFKGRIHPQNAYGLDEQDVAIKASHNASFETRNMWQAEVNYLQRFDHAHIIKLVGYCEDPGNSFILVYEYVAGGTLEEYRKRLNWEGILRVVRGVASGLQYIHGFEDPKLVYGDLKPGNILLLGEDHEPTISDFGSLTEENRTQAVYSMHYVDIEFVMRGK
ncbi:probable serine/threonine-protein kinase PBL23 [Cornus florida]|uniref:probable serine/threonine-protein kinase PBL23 n=1 Tax=Cornus florida TaxID=4283 RepID=UPI0028970815|nr:probable serine/threonine-protein kinase PBL23 [Cornus florida]